MKNRIPSAGAEAQQRTEDEVTTSCPNNGNTHVSGSADLDFVNSHIKKIENAEKIKDYYSKNRDKQKEKNKKWNQNNRREYQRNYRKMNGG